MFLQYGPLRLVVLAPNRADAALRARDHERWYIGGHSLGGVFAASYASTHGADLIGVILLAAYPIKPLGDDLNTVLIYGSKDRVLNLKRYRESLRYAPDSAVECVIAGGNHAGFGAYGIQKGDGAATISGDEQVRETVRCILDSIARKRR